MGCRRLTRVGRLHVLKQLDFPRQLSLLPASVLLACDQRAQFNLATGTHHGYNGELITSVWGVIV